MIIEQTVSKLRDLKFSAMADALIEQVKNKDYDSLSFEDRLSLLIDIEWDTKKNAKKQRLISKAGFRYNQACIEDIEYFQERKLNKSKIIRLASNEYILDHRNVIIKGPSGAGKTFIGCALGMAAIRHEHTVLYIRLPDLLEELAIARELGRYKKVMKKYKNVQLLVLDEFLLTELTEQKTMDVLELIEGRDGSSSTIFCSQFDAKGWYENLGQGTLADAVLDRIIHNSYDILIDSEKSMRERYGVESEIA